MEKSVYEYLDKQTKNFFPKTGEYDSSKLDEKEKLAIENMPFNICDDDWIVSMFIKHVGYAINDENIELVSSYIKESPIFNKRRYDYSLEIVKYQIQYMMDPDSDWFGDPEYGNGMMFFSEDYDKEFRESIVLALHSIGLDDDIIEDGIDTNLDIWLDTCVEATFYNNHYPVTGEMLFSDKEIDYSDCDEEYKEKWMKLRKHEYYMDHKESLIKNRVFLPESGISDGELKQLKMDVKHGRNNR